VYALKRVGAKVFKRKNCNSARQHRDRHPLVRRTSLTYPATIRPAPGIKPAGLLCFQG
jgi:hypothetical protein